MRKEDLKDWTVDRLRDEIVNLSEKNFNLEWRIKQFEESEGRWKCENESLKKDCKSLSDRALKADQENSMLKDMLKTSSESINVLKEKLSEYETQKAVASEYEPQFAPDDDISAFNYECVKRWTTEMGCKRKIQELQDQHQQDCIRYNDMRTAYLVTLDELARLREQFGARK